MHFLLELVAEVPAAVGLAKSVATIAQNSKVGAAEVALQGAANLATPMLSDTNATLANAIAAEGVQVIGATAVAAGVVVPPTVAPVPAPTPGPTVAP